MKDVLVFLAGRLQTFLPLFVRIVAHPRINILTLAQRPGAIADALAFFAICSAIGLVLQAPFLMERNEFTTAAGMLAIYKVMEVAIAAVALVGVFRLLRGKGAYEPMLSATFYIISPVYLFSVVMNLLINGLLTGYDQALAVESRLTGELSDGTVQAMWAIDWRSAAAVMVISFSTAAGILAWVIICWPVYIRLNEFGRWRGIASCVLGLAALYVVGELGLVLVSGLFPDGLGGAY